MTQAEKTHRKERVLITGTSSGFGASTVRSFLVRGHTVLATMRDVQGKNAASADRLVEQAKSLTGELHVFELDVLNDESVVATVETATDAVGGVDVVINNAGFGLLGISECFTSEQVGRIFETNVIGAHRVNRAVLQQMREHGRGLIIYTGSIMGRIVVPFSGPYTATKFATEAMAESLFYELNGTGVEVTILQPGGFPTEILNKIEPHGDPDRVASLNDMKERSDGLWAQWFAMLETAAPSPDLVAGAMLSIVESEPGTRPLRMIVDPVTGGMATETVNRVCADVQKELLTGIGFADVLPKR